MKQKIKVLAAFPQLEAKGGSERVLQVMAKFFDLSIITNKYNPQKTFDTFEKIDVIEMKKPNKFFFGMELAKTNFGAEYDVFHSHGYFINNFMAFRNHPALYYCITPKRDIYKLRKYHLNEIKNPIKRSLRNSYLDVLKIIDKKIVRDKIDGIVTISEEVAREVKKIHNRESKVIYPPTNLKRYKFKEYGDYFLCVSRLSPVKRIDVIVNAFNKMPDKKVKIAGFISDENYFKRLKSMAKKNIEFITNARDSEIIDLYSRCLCSINIPVREDFALTAVEALASGKPVILANEGALTEIIEHERQGLLIKPDVKNLINAVKWMTYDKVSKLRKVCFKRSELFGEETFEKEMTSVYRKLINGNGW